MLFTSPDEGSRSGYTSIDNSQDPFRQCGTSCACNKAMPVGAGGSPTRVSKLNVNAAVWMGSPSKAPPGSTLPAPSVASSSSGTIPAVSTEVTLWLMRCCLYTLY